MAQKDLSVEHIGPNLFSTKPGIMYFVEEIQIPILNINLIYYINFIFIFYYFIIF